MSYLLKQSSTARPLLFLMVDAADHIAGKTGLTPTVTIGKNGAAFASPAGAVSEISGGWYKVAGNATDTDTLGVLALHATASGADPTDKTFEVVVFDPSDAVRLGLSALPNANAAATGGLPVLDATGRVSANLTAAGGTALTFDGAGLMNVGKISGLTTAAKADALNAITGGANTLSVDSSHRVKALDSGGNTFTGNWVSVTSATITADSTGANPTVISYSLASDGYIQNVLVEGVFTSGDNAGVPFIGFADTLSTITLAYQLSSAFAIGDTFNLWVLGGPKVDPATGVAILTNASNANLANLANADVATSTRMVAGGSAMVGGYSLNPVTPTNLTNAIFTTTNRAATDSNNRVKTLDSGGNVFTYTAPDNANIVVAATNSATILGRIGTPAGASLSADVLAVKGDTGGLVTSLAALAAKFTGITLLANWLKAMLRKSAPDTTAATEIGGTYDATTDSQEAIRDRGDAAWVTGAGGGGTSGTTVNRTTTINEITKTIRQ